MADVSSVPEDPGVEYLDSGPRMPLSAIKSPNRSCAIVQIRFCEWEKQSEHVTKAAHVSDDEKGSEGECVLAVCLRSSGSVPRAAKVSLAVPPEL